MNEKQTEMGFLQVLRAEQDGLTPELREWKLRRERKLIALKKRQQALGIEDEEFAKALAKAGGDMDAPIFPHHHKETKP